MALSRTREYAADRAAPSTRTTRCRSPARSVSCSPASRCGRWRERRRAGDSSLYIVHPFSAGGMGNLFSTHPPLEERIKRLEEMARNGIQAR